MNNIKKHNLNGVYKIQCPFCNKFYVGQTKKRLLQRFSQHKNSYLEPHKKYMYHSSSAITKALQIQLKH